MKRRGIKSGKYIEYNLCTAVCIICDAKLCRDLFAKNKVKKRIKQGEKQERKIINNKTIGKIAYFSKKNVKSVEIK